MNGGEDLPRGGKDPTARARKRTVQRERWLLRNLELVVAGLVLLVLAWSFLDRAEVLLARAEKLAMEGVANQLRAALLHAAMGDLQAGAADPALQPGANPMGLLARPPGNYLGELENPEAAALPRGAWFFDLEQDTLVYVVAHPAYFRSPLPGPARARFRLRAGEGGAGRGSLAERVGAYRLEPAEPWRWLVP